MRKNEGLLAFKVTPNLVVIAKQGQDELLLVLDHNDAQGETGSDFEYAGSQLLEAKADGCVAGFKRSGKLPQRAIDKRLLADAQSLIGAAKALGRNKRATHAISSASDP